MQVSLLNYLECICYNAAVADIIALSSVPALLVRLVRVQQPPALRVRAASVLGTLIRFCGLLHEALPSTGRVSCTSLWQEYFLDPDSRGRK
jgi:hypothetical protein